MLFVDSVTMGDHSLLTDRRILTLYQTMMTLDALRKKTFENIFSFSHSQEHSLSFFSKICKMECNTTSDWLNHMV